MCEICVEKSVENQRPTDAIMGDGGFNKERCYGQTSCLDCLISAYQTLQENPNDVNALNVFAIIAGVYFTTPAIMYQQVRDYVEKSMEGVPDFVK